VFVLALDTSTPVVTVAVVAGTAALADARVVAVNQHGEVLAPTIADVLSRAGLAAGELAAVGVGVGPGPFTGLRVGIVTAKALADAIGVPAYGECSLDLFGARDSVVVTDARRREVYWAAYDETGRRVGGPGVASPADVPVDGRRITGPATELYSDLLKGQPAWPSAVLLATKVAARLGANEPPDPLAPLYLRRPDAKPPGPPKRVSA
jgi:tRNA threonylcarbamoyl adenosine modification protein YeaZ